MTKIKYFLLTTTLMASLGFLGYAQTDGFSPLFLVGPSFEMESLPVSQEIIVALSQPYRYLARGRQSFVFESFDGKYVLKFFNAPYLYLSGNSDKRKLRRQFFKEGYALAWKLLRQETGLVYVHQGKGGGGLPKVSCFNRAGMFFEFDLTQTAFVLQKKGVSLAEKLPEIFEKQGVEGVARILDAWFALIQRRLDQSVVDGDSNAILNFGLVDGQVVHLDPGRIGWVAQIDRKQEWERSCRQLRKWLRINIPESVDYFDQQLSKIVYK